MHIGTQLYLAVVLLIQAVCAANIIPENERCVTAVYTALAYVSFTGEPAVGAWDIRCRNPLMVTSIYAAAEEYCGKYEQTAGFVQLNSYCENVAHTELLPRENVAENLTDESVRKMRVVEFHKLSRANKINYPVRISPAYYGRTFNTIGTWQLEVWAHHAYGYLGYLYWGCILLVGTIYRLLHHANLSQRTKFAAANTSSSMLFNFISKLYQWAQKYLVIAFPFKSPSRKVLWFELPTRIDALVIAGFWLLSIVLTCITYPLFEDNIYWPSLSEQLLRYVADRTGIMSFANLPLLWLFAGRNNIFQWATGWSFVTFNIFHRHVAWIATTQAVIHTALYLVLFYQTSSRKLWKQLNKSYIIWGTVATVAMVAILPLAVNRIRKQSYEFFLLVHIGFSVATIIGCFYHIVIFKEDNYEYYLWPAVIIWVFDRVLRLIRVIYCNFHVHFRRAKLEYTNSVAFYDEASNVVRLEVIPASSNHRPTASSHYYLYQPFRFRGWENHPFTLGSWTYTTDTEEDEFNSNLKSTEFVDVSQIPLLSSPDQERDENVLSKDSKTIIQKPKLIFWIRPYDGWTRSLRDQCIASVDRTVRPKIFLEGPYGEPFPIENYDSVLLIAGGTGVACAVPYIKEQIRQSEAVSDGIESPRRDIHLVWAAREPSFIVDVVTRELQPALTTQEAFSALFHSTFATSSNTFKIPSHNSSATTTTQDMDIDIWPGRPDLHQIILEHAREASFTKRSTVIVVSGPTKMADEARAAVQDAMHKGYKGLVFREESFSW